MPDAAATPAPPTPPGLTPALRLEVEVASPQELGILDGWRRRIIPILGGRVSGRVSGEVMAGGADWQGVRVSDGLTRLHARYWLKLDDGTLVSVENVGVRRASPEITARLLTGQPVLPDSYYFRTAPSFEVAPGPHGWLADSVFVATAEREPAFVMIHVFEVC